MNFINFSTFNVFGFTSNVFIRLTNIYLLHSYGRLKIIEALKLCKYLKFDSFPLAFRFHFILRLLLSFSNRYNFHIVFALFKQKENKNYAHAVCVCVRLNVFIFHIA